jgi:ATP-dependent DNA helicase RecG
MSAFANTPGGGTIILGVDEQQGFQPVGVYDPALCQQAACNTARNALQPPIVVTPEAATIDGQAVVLVFVPEAGRDAKPVRVIKSGRAYMRMYDGDYRLSEAEEQILAAQRGQPRYDDQVVPLASYADLDAAAVDAYVVKRRASSGRFAPMSDREILVRTGVLSASGEGPTLAGLLALGLYPQQFFPSLALQASLVGHGSVRALDSVYLTGPIPAIVDDCGDWIRRVTPTAIMSDVAGHVADRPAYSPIAVRELVANALIHRDLSPAAVNQPVVLRLEQGERMHIVSPGGLYGISVDGLGRAPSSLRNARLTEVLQFVEHRGQRVVERIGSGIPAAQQALAEAGAPPLEFDDRGVRFTVTLRPGPAGVVPGLTLATQEVLDAFRGQPVTIAQLAGRSGKTPAQIRYAITKLVDAHLVTGESLDGRTRWYRRA